MMKKRGIITVFLAALLLLPGPASARHEHDEAPDFPNPLLLPGPPPVRSWIDLNTKEIGGPFTLIDQDGKNVTEKDYENYYKLILFGYTNSRVQAATLRKLVKALEEMGDDAEKVRILFFTTDPARDTPAAMKKFLEKLWSNKIVGLTGTVENVAKTENKFRIYAEKVTDPHYGGYTVNHSTVIYFTAPDGKFLTVVSPADSLPILYRKLLQKMNNPG